MFVPSTQERQKIPTSQITRGSPQLLRKSAQSLPFYILKKIDNLNFL